MNNQEYTLEELDNEFDDTPELTPNDIVNRWTLSRVELWVLIGATLLSIVVGGWLGFHLNYKPVSTPWPTCPVCHQPLPRFGPHYHLSPINSKGYLRQPWDRPILP